MLPLENSIYEMRWMFILWDASSIIVTPLYVVAMKRMKIIFIEKQFISYIFSLWVTYFISLNLGNRYLVLQVNKLWFGYAVHFTGLCGRLEDLIAQLAIFLPLYIYFLKKFDVSYANKKLEYLYVMVYFLINSVFWLAYLYSLA